MPYAQTAKCDTYARLFSDECGDFGITTPLRAAHFWAQIAHESGELRYTEEIASGKAYEYRKDLGNVQAGDGARYKGRGLVQLTGRTNYTTFAKAMGTDFVAHPELLSQPTWAMAVALWFWNTKGLNALADKDDIKAVTKRINGGYNGLTSRAEYLRRAKLVIK